MRAEPVTALGWLVPLVATVLRAQPVREALVEALADAAPGKPTNHELLTPDQLCDAMQISRSKLDGLIKEGLPFVKVGSVKRYQLREVLQWFRNREEAA